MIRRLFHMTLISGLHGIFGIEGLKVAPLWDFGPDETCGDNTCEPAGVDESAQDKFLNTMVLLSFMLVRGLLALVCSHHGCFDPRLLLGVAFAWLTRCISEGATEPSTMEDVVAVGVIAVREFLHAFGLRYILRCIPSDC